MGEFPAREGGRTVLYFMQQAKRAHWNHALEYAAARANELKLPLTVVFALVKNFPGGNYRHFLFITQGLEDLSQELRQRGIAFKVEIIENFTDLAPRIELLKPALLILDKGYLKEQREWRKKLVEGLKIRALEVETDVIVPVESVSNKQEFAARTIRPKIKSEWKKFAVSPGREEILIKQQKDYWQGDAEKLAFELVGEAGGHAVPAGRLAGGYQKARLVLNEFLENRLKTYDLNRNQPMQNGLSDISPYLHHGQIGVGEIVAEVGRFCAENNQLREAAEVFLEELVVRRELAINFCYYNQHYHLFEKAVPAWARQSLAEHAADVREYLYSREELEIAKTHDPIWNSCQNQMVREGKMHGYMRMYWGKKILEWSTTAEEAFDTAIYLNDKYELDGIDANGYTGVAWCFGLHDRPWFERKIFGKVRYMNDSGIKRKIKNWSEYVKKYS